MRVNVQYTVEVEKIPEEMEKLLQHSAVDRLRFAAEQLARVDLKSESLRTLDELDKIRKILFEVDERLSDVDGIMRGYYSQATAEPQVVPQAPEPEANLPVDATTMSQIKASLAEHKLETEALQRTFQNWGVNDESSDNEGR